MLRQCRHDDGSADPLGYGVQLDMEALYKREGDAPRRALQAGDAPEGASMAGAGGDSEQIRSTLSGIVWTPSMRRMYMLLKRCAARCIGLAMCSAVTL